MEAGSQVIGEGGLARAGETEKPDDVGLLAEKGFFLEAGRSHKIGFGEMAVLAANFNKSL